LAGVAEVARPPPPWLFLRPPLPVRKPMLAFGWGRMP
jgi:hypothetical protein